VADTVDLPKDGTAKITIGKDRYVLKQPTLGEMRKLRELYDVMIEEFRAVQSANTEMAMQEAANALDPKFKKKPRKKLDDDQMVVDLVREMFLTLSEAPLPPDDELPSWIVDGRFPKDLIEHWRTNPLHYGEK
jgi:hypothetical protein